MRRKVGRRGGIVCVNSHRCASVGEVARNRQSAQGTHPSECRPARRESTHGKTAHRGEPNTEATQRQYADRKTSDADPSHGNATSGKKNADSDVADRDPRLRDAPSIRAVDKPASRHLY